MREIMLHGGADEAFDQSLTFARRLAESFGAHLQVVYTVEDPLAAGWTSEVGAERMPEIHQAIEEEAHQRLERLIPAGDQERLNIRLVLRTGPAERELITFTEEHKVDLAIVQAPLANPKSVDLARALIDHARCAVLVLR